jgi:hypothetical protein
MCGQLEWLCFSLVAVEVLSLGGCVCAQLGGYVSAWWLCVCAQLG